MTKSIALGLLPTTFSRGRSISTNALTSAHSGDSIRMGTKLGGPDLLVDEELADHLDRDAD